MLQLFQIVIGILAVFVALGLGCAAWIGLRRDTRTPDPFSSAFGDVPSTGFTFDQLAAIAPSRPTGDTLNRHLDFPTSAGATQRKATGVRPTPSVAFARRIFPETL